MSSPWSAFGIVACPNLEPAHGASQAAAGYLAGLGDTDQAAGQPDQVRAVWPQALDIVDDLHHPSAEAIRDRLG